MKFQEMVGFERANQDARWGQQNHPDGTGKEGFRLWEASMKELNKHAVATGQCTWALILEEEVAEALATRNTEDLQTELVQVAAVCQAWHEAIERRKSSASR